MSKSPLMIVTVLAAAFVAEEAYGRPAAELGRSLAQHSVEVGTRDRIKFQVLLAKKQGDKVDKRVGKGIAKELKGLGFGSVEQIEAAGYVLAEGSKTKIRLPGGEWLELEHVGHAGPKLRLKMSIEKLKFGATVAAAEGSKVVARGPSYRGGTLVLVFKRPKEDPGKGKKK